MLQEFQNKRFHDIMTRMTAVGALNGLAYLKPVTIHSLNRSQGVNKIPSEVCIDEIGLEIIERFIFLNEETNILFMHY